MDDADWDGVELVVFDMDGTLYRQAPLRRRMAASMAIDALASRSLETIRVVSAYRRLREAVEEADIADFGRALVAQTAAATGSLPGTVERIIQEWLEQRPLRHLAGCRYPHVPALFDGLRRAGLTVAVLSDYPAVEKMAALGLACDHVVWAGDSDVGVLKPHPRGLEAVIRRAGAAAPATVMIGDRIDRDGAVARRVGAQALIRSSKNQPDWHCFASFDDRVFRRFL